MPNALLGVILWLTSKVLLPGVLILMHWSQQRLRSVPAPLFRRREPVPGKTRLREGAFGLAACYALCTAMFFVSFVGRPEGTSLTLNPADGSPAEQAGLLPGDRAHSVGGNPVSNFEEFRDRVARAPRTVSIEVERKGRLVPLHIRKDGNNRIGVVPEPGDPLRVPAALRRAVAAPMVVLTEWLATLVRPLLGEEVEIIGPIGIGRAASAGGVVVAHVLAMLMTLDLLVVVPIHAVVLVADSRSRRRYHAHVSSVGLGVAVFWLLAAPW